MSKSIVLHTFLGLVIALAAYALPLQETDEAEIPPGGIDPNNILVKPDELAKQIQDVLDIPKTVASSIQQFVAHQYFQIFPTTSTQAPKVNVTSAPKGNVSFAQEFHHPHYQVAQEGVAPQVIVVPLPPDVHQYQQIQQAPIPQVTEAVKTTTEIKEEDEDDDDESRRRRTEQHL